jgi:hypothetical protein
MGLGLAGSAGMLMAGTNGIHTRSQKGNPMLRGEEETFTVFDPRPCPMAPDFSGGYVSPFIKKDNTVAQRDDRHASVVNADG